MGVRHLAIRRRDFRPKQTFFFFATLAFFLDSDSFEWVHVSFQELIYCIPSFNGFKLQKMLVKAVILVGGNQKGK